MPVPPDFPTFAAVLLAGGKSQRMGRDKAALEWHGEPLWRRQLTKLQALAPAEIFISGPLDGPYAGAGVEIVPDSVPACGPLGGLGAIFPRARSEWLLVLAVDLPDLPVELLAELLRKAQREGIGVVPGTADRCEPLAAVYPRLALPWIEESLRGPDFSLQRWVKKLVAAGLVAQWPLPAADLHFFRNVNSPEDLSAGVPEWGS